MGVMNERAKRLSIELLEGSLKHSTAAQNGQVVQGFIRLRKGLKTEVLPRLINQR
jgi:hypothetical protein